MFNEQEFIETIRRKAIEKDLLKEANKELELYSKYHQIEYLYIVDKVVRKMKKECVPITMLRMGDASSVIAYLLGFHHINPKEYRLFNSLFFNRDYLDGINGPRFDFSVLESRKKDVLKILNHIEPIDENKSSSCIFYFGKNSKYRLGIYSSGYLDRLNSAMRLVKDDSIDNWCDKEFSELNDKRILDYMFAFDNKDFYMPNLHGCILGIVGSFYEFMEACEVHTLYDFALLNCLQYDIFKNKEVVIRSLKEDGLRGTICCKEQLLDILINGYDVEEITAHTIMINLLSRHSLSETEVLILKSHEIPEQIIVQLNNINYLHYLSYSMEEARIAYFLAAIKISFPNEFKTLTPIPCKTSFVGPFFYIDNKLYAYTDKMTSFSSDIRFFDSPMSHFNYFERLGIDGDYGNYPRGRVLFDNFHKRFMVYLDNDLMNNAIKNLIIKEYCLEKHKTTFKRDTHYKHDYL